jgi:hypothetical protein
MKRMHGLIMATGILLVTGLTAPASAQCGNPGAPRIKSNEYFTVLKNGKIKLREGVQIEKVIGADGREVLRIFSNEKAAAAEIECGCGGPFTVKNCATIISGGGGSAQCVGECRNGDVRSFCNFTFVQPQAPDASAE